MNSKELPTEIAHLLRLVIQEPYSPHRMEPHGLLGHLELHIISGESTMSIVPFLQWVNQEPSLPHRMASHGLQGHLVLQTVSMESPTKNNPLF